MLVKRFGDARLDEVRDRATRTFRVRRLAPGGAVATNASLGAKSSGSAGLSILAALLGMVAGSRSLREVEQLTDELTPPIRNGVRVANDNRYFVSSLPRSRLTDAEWLLVVRRHWGVETAHQLQGGAFAEDNHPWIEQNPRATVVVMVLGRIAYTLLALWRGVTLRSKQQRTRPWRELMHDIWLGAVQATAQIPCGSSSRDRRLPPAPA
ncbi:MAG: hypothetical protein AMXMBFR56_28450 [Polyangiaceae bacterium]